MLSSNALDHREGGRQLAILHSVYLSKPRPAAVSYWLDQGLALMELARRDRAEADRIMAPVSKRRRRGTNLAACGAPKEEA